MIKMLEEILCSLNYAPPNAPASKENAPVSVKSGAVLHPLSDYGKITNEGCDLLRFAPFCKKCYNRGDKTKKYKSAKRAKTRHFRAFLERNIL